MIERPIFIIGTGCSGTTLLFDVLSKHPDMAWPCQYMEGHELSRRDKLRKAAARLPVVGQIIDTRRYQKRPAPEPYRFWEQHYRGFSQPVRDLVEQDVPTELPAAIQQAVADQQADMEKPRFLTKYTGWSRIRFIDVIFPDALYLNVVRDGRAVAHSLMQTSWWRGWEGPQEWRWGPLADDCQELWDRSGQSFFVLAGIQWKILMDNITRTADAISDRYREIRYEELVGDPQRVITDLCNWCGLADSSEHREAVQSLAFRNANGKWKKEIPPAEQKVFESALGPTLGKYGYRTQGDPLL